MIHTPCYVFVASRRVLLNVKIMNLKDVMSKDVEIIDIENSTWNCDKCIFFKPKECECNATKRLLFGQALNDDCDDCERPFVLRTE